jgi:hypothetical protein
VNSIGLVAKFDIPIIDFINDAEGKLIQTNLLIEIATKHLGSPHHQERMVTFFTQMITIGFGSIKHCIYKARIFTAVDAEMRAITKLSSFVASSVQIHALVCSSMLRGSSTRSVASSTASSFFADAMVTAFLFNVLIDDPSS